MTGAPPHAQPVAAPLGAPGAVPPPGGWHPNQPTATGGGGPPPATQPTDPAGHPLPTGQNPQSSDPAQLPGGAPHPTTGPQVQSGGTPAKLDAASRKALTDYVNQLPAGLRNNPLNFETSAIPRDQLNALVTKEGGSPDRVNSTINDIGGPNAQVSRTPILISNGKGEFSAKSLISVKDSSGATQLVDQDGAKYQNMQDYLENNRLDKSWTITHPAGLGTPGADAGQIVTGPAHVVSQGEQAAETMDKVAAGLGVAATTTEVAGAVVEGSTLGAGTPVAAALEGVGGVMQSVSGGWSTLRMIDQAMNNYDHGRDITDGIDVFGAAENAAGRTVGERAAAGSNLRGEATPEEAKETFGDDPEHLPPDQKSNELAADGTDVGLIKPSLLDGPESQPGTTANRPAGVPELKIDQGQFGSKAGKHSKEWQFNPGDKTARAKFQSMINNIAEYPDEVRQGPYNPDNGGGSDYLFFKKADGTVLAKPDGTFVSILKDAENNHWWTGARPLK